MIVLDTNVVAALMRRDLSDIDEWLGSVERTSLYLTTVTRAEIRYGIERLASGQRRRELAHRADAVFDEAADRTLVFDSAAADRFGELVARRERAGRPIATADAQIAAIARAHRATVATRNVRDFEGTGVRLVDPFSWGARP